MTLEQALVRLSNESMWLRPYAGRPLMWIVWGYRNNRMEKVSTGATWQEAYAGAMNEAPF